MEPPIHLQAAGSLPLMELPVCSVLLTCYKLMGPGINLHQGGEIPSEKAVLLHMEDSVTGCIFFVKM